MNHLAATHGGSSPGLPMQMSTHLLEPVPVMSWEMETKIVHYTVGAHTCMSPRDTVTDERDTKQLVGKMCINVGSSDMNI